jgi:hypothetical protein
LLNLQAGISSEDLEAAVEGNLVGNLFQALDAAEFRQMYRDQKGTKKPRNEPRV